MRCLAGVFVHLPTPRKVWREAHGYKENLDALIKEFDETNMDEISVIEKYACSNKNGPYSAAARQISRRHRLGYD